MATKIIRRAKVVLIGAKSYKHAGKTYLKGESYTVKGDDVQGFLDNGYFRCRELESIEKEVKKKKKKKVLNKKSSSSKKTSKKKTKKKALKKKVKTKK